MTDQSREREAKIRKNEALVSSGREVSMVSSGDVLCRPCLAVGTIGAAFWALVLALNDGFRDPETEAFRSVLIVGLIGYAVSRFLRAAIAYEGPKTRVVLAAGQLLFREFSLFSTEFERVDFRHVLRVDTRRIGLRRTVLVIRIDYARPGEPTRYIEFVPASEYRFDAQDGNPLADEMRAQMNHLRRLQNTV